jgi:hypothetical protein
MVNLEYHKGSFCVYTSVFCQEGYCSGCNIYLKRPAPTKQTVRHLDIKSQKVFHSALTH